MKEKVTARSAFTVIELVVVVGLISVVMVVGIGLVLADAHRAWDQMYDRMYSDVVVDGYVARRKFDREIRRASGEQYLLGEDGSWIEVYGYADSNSAVVDRYTCFYEDDGYLKFEYGTLSPREIIRQSTVCGNVSGCVFKGVGRSAQMILTLDNGQQTVVIVSSSVMQNY